MTDLLKAMETGLHYLEAKLAKELFYYRYQYQCEVCVLTALAMGLQLHGAPEADKECLDFAMSLEAISNEDQDERMRSFVYGAIQEYIPVSDKDLRALELSYDVGDLTAEQVIEELQSYKPEGTDTK